MIRRASRYTPEDTKSPVDLSIETICEMDAYWQAVVSTWYGYVFAEVRTGDPDTGASWPATILWFIWRGVRYWRTYPVAYTPRYVTRLAVAFAREVAEGGAV